MSSYEPVTLGNLCLTPSRNGNMLYNRHDLYVGRSFDLYGEFSQGEADLFAQIIGPGDVVIDVGANIGAHTVFFAKAVGPNGMVMAFEPQRFVYQNLCANLAINDIANTYAWNMAVGEQPGQITVPLLDYSRENNFGGLGLGEIEQGETINVIPLDSIPIARCKLLKIDVEGMELSVINGARALIKRHKPMLYVENDRADRSAALIRGIDALGYDMYWHRPPLYNPENFKNSPVNVFDDIVSLNMLCIDRSIKHNLQNFQKVVVP